MSRPVQVESLPTGGESIPGGDESAPALQFACTFRDLRLLHQDRSHPSWGRDRPSLPQKHPQPPRSCPQARRSRPPPARACALEGHLPSSHRRSSPRLRTSAKERDTQCPRGDSYVRQRAMTASRGDTSRTRGTHCIPTRAQARLPSAARPAVRPRARRQGARSAVRPRIPRRWPPLRAAAQRRARRALTP